MSLDESVLDVHVHVFERGIHGALAALEFARHPIQTGDDLLGVVGRDQSHRRQHAGMGLAAAHIVAQQALVEIHACVQRCRRLVHSGTETRSAAAGLGRRPTFVVLCLIAHRRGDYQGPAFAAPPCSRSVLPQRVSHPRARTVTTA